MHGIVWQTVADAAALAALAIIAADVDQRKVVYQTDTKQLWIPTSVTPTFSPLSQDTPLDCATTALTNADQTIATTVKQVMVAGTTSAARVKTITPSADSGIAFPIYIGTQGHNVTVTNGGGAGGSTIVTAGQKRVVWCLSDGANVTFTKSVLGAEPLLIP